MDLAARLHDVSARTEHDLLVLGPEADLALEHDGELILAVVDVGQDDSADLEGVFDDGEGPTGVGTVDLEDHPDAGHQFAAPTFTVVAAMVPALMAHLHLVDTCVQ